MEHGPIGVFDSGFGGLTVLKEIETALADNDFLYLGDNARTPYGNRSFEIVYTYTLEAVKWLFDRGCRLVIIACNTAAAKALRTIQQKDLPRIAPARRVLGILRPVTERIGHRSKSKHIGILATAGTVASNSYAMEIKRFFPDITVVQEACPMWVPLVENNERGGEGADYFIKQHIDRLTARDPRIDTVVLGCTHYPLLQEKIARYLPPGIEIVSQGPIVAESLADYLKRHPEIAARCGRGGRREFYTSEKAVVFDKLATLFYGKEIHSREMEFSR
ncbi:MAG: glutamate racemase [Acidobacteria bacterium]|nr:glutamate racemase [Acidobacteriota bacterium]